MDILDGMDNTRIVSVEPTYGDLLVCFWRVGMRPLFTPLVKMANNIDADKRIEVKNEWNDIFYTMFHEYIRDYVPDDDTAIEYTIVLEKT